MTNTVRVNGESFRKAVKSVITVTDKKGTSIMMYCVLFRLSEKILDICANSIEQAVDFTVYECDETSGSFSVVVNGENAKSLLNIKGKFITLSYEDKASRLKVSDGKKTMQIECLASETDEMLSFEHYTSPFSAENGDYMELFKIQSDELLTGIKKADKFREAYRETTHRRILTGYHFNGQANKIEALEGHMMYRKAWKTLVKREGTEYDFTVQPLLENIKNIFDGKIFEQISVISTNSGKYTMFTPSEHEGYDVSYAVMNFDKSEGTFHNCDASIPREYCAEISVKAGNITDIAKEYKSYMSDKNKHPMVFGTYNGKLYGCVRLNTLIVSQPIDSAVINGKADVFAGYNAGYTLNCFSVYDKDETVSVRYNGALSPMYITNGEYETLLLPVRLKDTARETFENTCA